MRQTLEKVTCDKCGDVIAEDMRDDLHERIFISDKVHIEAYEDSGYGFNRMDLCDLCKEVILKEALKHLESSE